MKVLIDSDAFFALSVAHDPHHKKAKKVFHDFLTKNTKLYTSNLVIQETCTVLSHKYNQKSAIGFSKFILKLPINRIFVDEKTEHGAWQVFLKEKKKGTSFVDCSNLAILKEHKLDKIFSFDGFYGELRI